MNKTRGTLVVFTGPSGVGKGTVLNAFRQKGTPFYFSISATTRKPRPGEVDGVNYYFLTTEAFETMIREDQLFEYAQYVGNYYGTPVAPVLKNLEDGTDVILEIETQGAMQIRKKYPAAVLVFVAPPSIAVLHERLSGRGTESDETVAKRMNEAKQELARANEFDYIIINDTVEDAAEELAAILKAEKCKTANRIELIK